MQRVSRITNENQASLLKDSDVALSNALKRSEHSFAEGGLFHSLNETLQRAYKRTPLTEVAFVASLYLGLCNSLIRLTQSGIGSEIDRGLLRTLFLDYPISRAGFSTMLQLGVDQLINHIGLPVRNVDFHSSYDGHITADNPPYPQFSPYVFVYNEHGRRISPQEESDQNPLFYNACRGLLTAKSFSEALESAINGSSLELIMPRQEIQYVSSDDETFDNFASSMRLGLYPDRGDIGKRMLNDTLEMMCR